MRLRHSRVPGGHGGESGTPPQTRPGCAGGRELGWDRDSATARPPLRYLGDSEQESNFKGPQLLALATPNVGVLNGTDWPDPAAVKILRLFPRADATDGRKHPPEEP